MHKIFMAEIEDCDTENDVCCKYHRKLFLVISEDNLKWEVVGDLDQFRIFLDGEWVYINHDDIADRILVDKVLIHVRGKIINDLKRLQSELGGIDQAITLV